MDARDSEIYCAAYAATEEGGLDHLTTEYQIGAEDFQDPEPFAVMEVAEDLHEDGQNVTPHAIRHELKARDAFGECGGQEWWSSFVGKSGEGDDIKLHAEYVSLASRLRDIDEPAEEIHGVCNNGHHPKAAMEEVEDLTQELLEAQASSESNVMDGRDIGEGIMELVSSDEPANLKLKTGWPQYDGRFGGLVQNRINVFAARTDHGKSAAADQIALNVARRGKRVIKFDLENDESAVQMRLASNLSGVPIGKISDHAENEGKLADPELKSIHQAADQVGSLPLLIDHTPGASSTYVRSRVLTEQARHDVGLVIVDYITQMGDPGDKAMDQVMNAITGLHNLAQELEVPVLAISQVNRKSVSGDDAQPKLHHMSWSDDVAQKPAQVTTMLHHLAHWDQTSRAAGGKPDPEKLTLHVCKNKGTKGPLELSFQKDCLRIVDQQDPQPYENDDAPF